MGQKEHPLPPVFPWGLCMVTHRLSVSPRRGIGTALDKDTLFDFDEIETQQRSEAMAKPLPRNVLHKL